MKKHELLDEILLIIRSVKDDKDKLEQILFYLNNEVLEEPEQVELPEKYKKIVPEIAENIDCGLICYLNMDTLEIEDVPENLINDPDEYELITGESFDSLELKHLDWENFIKFKPLEPYESFEIMKYFTENMEDTKLQRKLINALNHKKPFANFKAIIDNSQYRQYWFDYKKHWIENYVKELLFSQLDEVQEDYHEEINGIYNDDGTKVDIQSIPLPGLCVICKSYQTEDWEENLLCQMNRHDQRNDDEFKCGTFENI